ncbi:hypothetical protein [Robertmurraya andreesenii]|uniref:NADH-flavin reductase n=1 Tax=Anoxybacillus andreesenii TaxID=1325932 RepID=A0ABT9UYV3_9BACL|nr:hypothetical protein [Robertmurraya andreesenii]MDQ0153883.1 hypothetical protein [Robertmurraya andreesenii]
MMERAVIIGVFENFGFQLCNRILETGLEVDGIHLEQGKDKSKAEERRLYIGRNANFSESEMKNFDLELLKKEGTFLFIDLCEQFRDAAKPATELEALNNIIANFRSKKGKVIFLLPISLLVNTRIEPHPWLEKVFDLLRHKEIPFKLFYFPSSSWEFEVENESSIRENEITQEYINDLIHAVMKLADATHG